MRESILSIPAFLSLPILTSTIKYSLFLQAKTFVVHKF